MQGSTHGTSEQSSPTFTADGVEGIGNQEITMEVAVRLAAAYACLLEKPGRIGISACAHPFSQLLKHGMMTSLCCAGMETVDFGIASQAILCFGMQRMQCLGSIHLQVMAVPSGKVHISFLDQDGQHVSKAWMDRLKEAFAQRKMIARTIEQLGHIHVKHDVAQEYLQKMLEETMASIQHGS